MPLNVLTSPWPFVMWGIDVIRRIEPTASNGHLFILVAIEYFTKWVEAVSYANVTRQVVDRFIRKEIICRYGVPNKIITDNGSNLNNKMVKELCRSFKIDHHNSSPYRPKMNGVVEAANKTLRRSCKRWWKPTKIGMKCSHSHYMAIVPQYILPLGQLPSLLCMAWM